MACGCRKKNKTAGVSTSGCTGPDCPDPSVTVKEVKPATPQRVQEKIASAIARRVTVKRTRKK